MEVALDFDLPLRTVQLAAPTDPSRPLSEDSEIAHVAEQYVAVPESFALEAGVFRGADLSVGWKVRGRGHEIELYPLELEASRLQGPGTRIRLHVPAVVLPHCLSLASTDLHTVVDFITDSGHLYCVTIPHLCFRSGDETKANVAVKLTRQHSLDLVAPRLLKSVDAHTMLMPLVDGSLVRLDRASPQDSPTATTLVNPLTKPAASGLARIFRSSSDKVPGRPRLSVNAACSLQVVGDHVIAYSVNNSVHTWSLKNNTCTQVISSDSPAVQYRLRPTEYVTSKDGTVVVDFPEHIETFALVGDQLVSRSTTTVPTELRQWFVTSLGILEDGRVIVSFKLDMCARIYIVSEEWSHVGGYDHTALLDLPINDSITQTKKRVLETDAAVVRLALSKLAVNVDPDQTAHGLIQSFEDELNTLIGTSTESKSQWLRLDTLCREIEAEGGELLAIAPALYTEGGAFLWSLRVSGVTMFCVTDDNTRAGIADAEEVLVTGRDLLSTVPESTLERVSELMLSSDLLMDRLESACTLLKKHIDQIKLSQMSRTDIGPRLRRYIATFGPSEPSAPQGSTQLSKLGREAAAMLLYDYASHYAKNFQTIVSLAAVSLVDGWLQGDSDLLLSAVEVLRRFSFISRVGLKNLHFDEDVYLEDFGIHLAKQLAYACDPVDVLSRLLPVSEPVAEITGFTRAAGLCPATPELTVLKGMAFLAVGNLGEGVRLAQHVSLSRPWPKFFGAQPQTQAEWLYRIAEYAASVNAQDAALRFVRLSESLVEPADPVGPRLHELLFKLAIKAGDIASAYSALIRRFTTYRDPEVDELANEWISELITSAAQQGDEEARELVVSYPFIGFAKSLQKTLATTNSFASVPAYKLRYAWFVAHDDFVGAANVVYEHIRNAADAVRKVELYTVCLNALSLVAAESQWLKVGDTIVHFDDIKLEQDELLVRMAQQI